MSYWNYRILKDDFGYAVHEVYYNDKGKITFWTQDPIEVTGGSLVELEEEVYKINQAFSRPILRETKKGKLKEI